MEEMGVSGAMKTLIAGQISLTLCCIFYLLWWRAGFYPGVTVNRVAGKVGLLLYITAVLGILGVILSVTGINHIAAEKDIISGPAVLIGGVIAYIVLLLGSRFLLHRQVTTELFLIVGWSVLMILSIGKAYSAAALSHGSFIAMLVIIAAAAILSMIFYLAYYNVEPMRGFVFGMIPLITEALSMLIFTVMLIRRS